MIQMINSPKTSAFSILFEEHYPKIFKATLLFCDDYHLAEDATQEAFYRAYNKLHKLRDKNKFDAWVYVIATNIIKTEYKKNKNFKTTDNSTLDEMNLNNHLEALETKEEVLNTLRKLNYEHRQVLILKYIFGFSLADIAEKTNVMEGTVKSRLYRAKQKFKSIFNHKKEAKSTE